MSLITCELQAELIVVEMMLEFPDDFTDLMVDALRCKIIKTLIENAGRAETLFSAALKA